MRSPGSATPLSCRPRSHSKKIAVVRDSTAAAQVPEGDGYLAALINFHRVANGVWWTDDAVKRIAAAYA